MIDEKEKEQQKKVDEMEEKDRKKVDKNMHHIGRGLLANKQFDLDPIPIGKAKSKSKQVQK